MNNSYVHNSARLLSILIALGVAVGYGGTVYPARGADIVEQKSAFDEGMDQYKMKRFHAASDCFVRAVNQDPRNQKHHYYLALCLEQLKDYDGAKDEYSVAYQLNPFTLEGGCARDAVIKVSGRKAALSHPADGVRTYEQASREISRQTQDLQGRWITDYRREAAFQSYLGQYEAHKVLAESNQRLSGIRGRHSSLIMSDAQQQARFLILDSQVQSNLTTATGYHAAAEVQLSSNLLKQLMSEPVVPGKPHLRALGTNLYVRNYSQFDDELPPADPPLELRATAHSFADLPVELHAQSVSLSDLSKQKM